MVWLDPSPALSRLDSATPITSVRLRERMVKLASGLCSKILAATTTHWDLEIHLSDRHRISSDFTSLEPRIALLLATLIKGRPTEDRIPLRRPPAPSSLKVFRQKMAWAPRYGPGPISCLDLCEPPKYLAKECATSTMMAATAKRSSMAKQLMHTGELPRQESPGSDSQLRV